MLLPVVMLFSCLALAAQPVETIEFFSPQRKREVWRIGETKTVRYFTKHKNYTIALWQQAMAGGSARMGPVIVDSTDGPEKEFTWKVDLGKLELGASDLYYFWFFEGDRSMQGRAGKGVLEKASALFNVTDKPAPRSSSRTTSTSTSKSTSSSTVSSTTIPLSSSLPPPPSTKNDAAEVITITESLPESTAAASAPTATTKIRGSFDENKPLNPEDFNLGSSESLPVAAQAGIGVGVGVVGASCIICVVLWVRYLKKKRMVVAELPGGPLVQNPPAYVCNVPEAVLLSDRKDQGYYVNKKPVEID